MDDLITREIVREYQNDLEKVFRQFPSLRGVAQSQQQERVRFGRWIAVEPDEKGNTDVWLCSDCKKLCGCLRNGYFVNLTIVRIAGAA